MGPFEMIVAIVLIVTIGSVINHRRDRTSGAEDEADWDDGEVSAREVKQLRTEIKAMKDRVAVLERIATDHDKTITLDREIEALRDR